MRQDDLMDLLRGREMTYKEIMAESSLPRSQVARAMARLSHWGLVEYRTIRVGPYKEKVWRLAE